MCLQEASRHVWNLGAAVTQKLRDHARYGDPEGDPPSNSDLLQRALFANSTPREVPCTNDTHGERPIVLVSLLQLYLRGMFSAVAYTR